MRMGRRLKLRTLFPGILTALLAMIFLTPGARASQTTFYLTGVGSGNVLDGVYTSPYSASIPGPSGPTIAVICDDFVDSSFVPENWTANVTQMSSFPVSTPDNLKFTGATASTFSVGVNSFAGWNLSQSTAYTVAAYLATEILAATTTTQQEDYSYALWELFSESNVYSWLTTTHPDSATLIAASNDVESAITYVSGHSLTPASFSNVTIYSYASGAKCPSEPHGACTDTPPQEFIVVTPEPASMLLFGTGLLAMGFLIRRKHLFT